MAYRQVNIGDSISKFVCDSVLDIAGLPSGCMLGSSAIVLENGSTYYVNSNGDWIFHGIQQIYGVTAPSDDLAVMVGIGGTHIQVVSPIVLRMSNGVTWEVLP